MSTKKKVVDKSPKEATLMTTFVKSITASSSWPDKVSLAYALAVAVGLAVAVDLGLGLVLA